jgi:hypothetical protein
MRAARYCSTGVWLEREFIGLSATAQRVFYAAWTAPETQTCGITTIGASALASRLRLPVDDVDAALLELASADRISVDPHVALTWLHGFLEMQLGGAPLKSQSWLWSTVSAVSCLPDCDLTRRFRAHYGLPDAAEGRVPTGRGQSVDGVSAGSRQGVDGVSNSGGCRQGVGGVSEIAPLPDPISPSLLLTDAAEKVKKIARGRS